MEQARQLPQSRGSKQAGLNLKLTVLPKGPGPNNRVQRQDRTNTVFNFKLRFTVTSSPGDVPMVYKQQGACGDPGQALACAALASALSLGSGGVSS